MISVRIAKDVRWDIALAKGARQVVLALGSGRVHSIELGGGADQADVPLPRPDGELVTRIPTELGGVSFHAQPESALPITFGSGHLHPGPSDTLSDASRPTSGRCSAGYDRLVAVAADQLRRGNLQANRR